jgi:adenosyl cobinamide kinase/adenosyl cobinamide phosphate guanylyltransferase
MSMTLLLGGARSGKSGLSTRLAASADRPVVVVATAEGRDEEMADRIRRHREARPSGWTTVEEPLALASAVRSLPSEAFAVVDCLSLWVSNAMEAGASEDEIVAEARAAASTLVEREPPSVVISNEVGLGIVPVNELARHYRDVLGRVNVAFADAATEAYFVVAGKALPLQEPTLA